MPNTPCWADMAAAEYADDTIEDYIEAVSEISDELDGWAVECVRKKLKPHEAEILDGIIFDVAVRLLEERARDNQPDEPIDADWRY